MSTRTAVLPGVCAHFSQVTKTYGDKTAAVRDVTLEIPAGQFCVLLGVSGAGKSTLLRMVNGIAIPTRGTVTVDGHPVGSPGWRRLQGRMGMIHQQFNLVRRSTVMENILSGALPATPFWRAATRRFTPVHQSLACNLVERVGLGEEHLQRRASELSGGQQQRVGIARAFILNPRLVLADEPVASLDPRTSHEILALLHSASREHGCTVLCSLHQLDLAREFADRIIGLRAGMVVFDGEPSRLDKRALDTIYANAPRAAKGDN